MFSHTTYRSAEPANFSRIGTAVLWLWRRTSLLTQVLHSGTSFLLMAGMARLAPTEAFALAAAFFLLATLCSSLNIYLLSTVWLRLEGDDAVQRLEGFSRILGSASALLFALFWLGYRGWAFGRAPTFEVLLVGLATFAYLYFCARRRQLLLDGRFGAATVADTMRASIVTGAASATLIVHGELDFERFLAIFAAAHLIGVLPLQSKRSLPAPRRHQPLLAVLARALSPLQALRRGDWLSIGSGIANVVFSQSASLLAPVLVGPTQYATLRAYELFLFPAFFMVQILDPICMRIYRDLTVHVERRRLLPAIAWPTLAIVAPLAFICLAVWFSTTATDLLQALIAPEYRGSFWLLAMVMGLSSLIATNVPLRWYTTVTGQGAPLMLGTSLGIVLSLVSLFTLTHIHAEAWTVLASKMIYELTLALAGSLGIVTFWRSRVQKNAHGPAPVVPPLTAATHDERS